ncbi:TPA: hypothetical protein N0F65_003376 [Lagenidium giganteum]|uniref:phosphoethanolamine N-methyltransferase n=1 Tax=Lagenidium giganteum TaxID=4803 RepID=A0AAV2ZAQ9_9STRA|nr:TPA: hypothetical protein N0F65_003376 [Lagenidium giganteum]
MGNHEADAIAELQQELATRVQGKDVLEIALDATTSLLTAAPAVASAAKSVAQLLLPPTFGADHLTDWSERHGRQTYDFVCYNRLLTFASEGQVRSVALFVLQSLRADGLVWFRESCFQAPFDVDSAQVAYRHPSIYAAVFGSLSGSQGQQFGYLDFVSCHSLGVYRKKARNHGELVFVYVKAEQPNVEASDESSSRARSASQQMDSFQNFLDNQQYSNASITRYEKIFGKGYVSTGGQTTTTEFVAKLNLQPGQRVLDVGCGIGGGNFYMANTFGVSVVGVDLSTNMVFRAMEQFPNCHNSATDVEFEVCDATTKQFPPASFDVVYSRDTILHIEGKEALFQQFLTWLKPGGQLLISDYCCGEQPPSDRFHAYVKSRGYILLSPTQYGKLLEKVGFVDVVAEDRTDQFVQVLKDELARTYQTKKQFIEETSEVDFNAIVKGWEAKQQQATATMNVIAEIQRINERELEMGVPYEASWHQKYKESAWVYVGGLPYELTEGDVLCVMSQFGEIEDINLVRDGKTGKSQGFAFLKYENQKSTVLAVDNMNGARLLERTIRVDHVLKYKLPKEIRDREDAKAQEAASDEEQEHKPRGLPGHAYDGKELATKFDISQGQNVFAAPDETKKEKKKRKKSEKKEKKHAKKMRKIEEKQAKLFEEIRKRREVERQREEAALRAQMDDPEGGVAPSATGWRGRLEPGAPAGAPKRRRPDDGDRSDRVRDDAGNSQAEYEQRERKRRDGYGGINRVR